MTILKFREEFKKIDCTFDKRMSMIELLLYWYSEKLAVLMTRAEQSPQVANELLEAAQAALDSVNTEIARIEEEKSRLEADSEGTGVKAMRSRAALAALLSADQTELNKRLLTAEAAVRKAKNAPSSGNSLAKLWWLERDVTEAKKYKPQGKKKPQ
eukprot:TRINITY_DN7112_c0_g2_i11.p1 TRINITY_DN7112_c0_g2~~TRINITY_DN7112_c0_g2_i11.p1  ORF type:complete len:156 (+),score=42.83 TRINITY_DN7112_c0_g2_i11:420-887(+)